MKPGNQIARKEQRRARKRRAFVDAAHRSFLVNGYAATTMSTVAASVGGSKSTLWSYFPSKEMLLSAVLEDLAALYCDALATEWDVSEPFEGQLRRFAQALVHIETCAEIIAMQRVVIGEAGRCPDLGQMFFSRGPRLGNIRIATFIAQAMETGKLRPGDAALAASQLFALCKAELYQQALLGVDMPDPSEIDATIDAALNTFMRAWGVTTSKPS